MIELYAKLHICNLLAKFTSKFFKLYKLHTCSSTNIEHLIDFYVRHFIIENNSSIAKDFSFFLITIICKLYIINVCIHVFFFQSLVVYSTQISIKPSAINFKTIRTTTHLHLFLNSLGSISN